MKINWKRNWEGKICCEQLPVGDAKIYLKEWSDMMRARGARIHENVPDE